jgi:mono/diheme cytochrome c family protein
MKRSISIPLVCTLAALALTQSACFRGGTSEKPPIHPNRNMFTQEKYKPQRESKFFVDGKTMQTPPANSVARGELRDDAAAFKGKTGDGAYVDIPVPVTPALLERGTQRYNIYCVPCHGPLGNGRGKIMDYKFPIPPTSYFDPRILQAKDGYIFEVISNGIRNMASYKAQIPVADRWAIVAHVRELQKAQLPDSLKGVIPNAQTAAVR